METKNYGFIASEIDSAEHYIFGSGQLPAPILMPGGHGWGAYLPADEFQERNGLETMNCTNYGTLHALATLGNYKFNKNGKLFQADLSERYTGIMTNTTPYGNDPHRVIELIRTTCGVIPEAFLPFDNTISSWMKYYSPSPMKYSLYAIGAHWLKKYKVGHDWVWLISDSLAVKQQKIKDALQYSPLGVSVFAWSQHTDGLFYHEQPINNHWVELYDYVEGQYWMIFDSYDMTHKKLDWNFDFGQGKRYTLEYNIGGAVLGDTVEQVYLGYAAYLAGEFINEILK